MNDKIIHCKNCCDLPGLDIVFGVYAWNSRHLDDDGEHFINGQDKGILCEKCAKRLGAWPLRMVIEQWQKKNT